MSFNQTPLIASADPAVTGVDPAMVAANASTVQIPTNIDPRTPTVVVDNATVPWHRRIRWHHVAVVVVITLVLFWLLTGEDPVETTKEVVKETVETTKEVVKEAASAVGA